MSEIIMITGANAGIGKETARQLALKKETRKIYLACRNPQKAAAAKKELEEETGRSIFEILIMDVSKPNSVKEAVAKLQEPLDALVMNAGGMGGRTPSKVTEDGVTQIAATNLLGHAVLLEELLEANKLTQMALFASSEVARGVKKMGIKQPDLKAGSVQDFASILNGEAFGKKADPMEIYGSTKLVGTFWMAHMARKYPNLKLMSMSPGGTRGTEGFSDMPFFQRIFYKYIGMPIVMPLLGLSHSLQSGAKRFVNAVADAHLKSGAFYASRANVLTGPIVDQSTIFPDLKNTTYQDNANEALHRFIH